MPIVLCNKGPLRVNIRYVHKRKSDGLFFYYRRIPRALKHHYPNAGPFIRRSLGTKDPAAAVERAIEHAGRDDALWLRLSASGPQQRGAQHGLQDSKATTNLLTKLLNQRLAAIPEDHALSLDNAGPLLSEVTKDYLRHHRKGQVAAFVKVTRLGIEAVLNSPGDLPLRHYTRKHARATPDYLMSAGNRTGTVRRRLRTIIAVVNHGISEHAPDIANVFSKLKIPHEAADTGSREPFTPEELRSIARSCERADDDLRHLVAIILDTGARLSEIVGLRREDLKLTGPVPHLWICEDLSWCHRGGRQLLSQRRGKTLPF